MSTPSSSEFLIKASIPTISNTIGSLFIGWGASAIFFGILCMQSWSYFTRFPNDAVFNKLLVSFILVLESIHQVFIGYTSWHYCVQYFGLFAKAAFEPTIWSMGAIIILGALVGTIVKIYFGWRVFKLSRGNVFWPSLICVMAVAQLGVASVFSMKCTQTVVAKLMTLKTLGVISLSLGAATDVVSAFSLSYYLHAMRTGYRRSDTLINRLIVFSVNTGVITSIFSLTVVILYQLMPTNLIFIACFFIVCKLYSNSFIATLNSREFIGGREAEVEMTPNGQSVFMFTGSRNGTFEGKVNHMNVKIDVCREVSVKGPGAGEITAHLPSSPASAVSRSYPEDLSAA